MKETFIIRTEWYDAISELSDLDKLTIFDNLFHYHMGNINLINLNNLTVKLVWKFIEPSLVRNIENYDKRRETSARNGALGGRPQGEVEIFSITGKKIPSVLDSGHFIYLIYDSVNDEYKIGETQNLKKRRQSIKRQSKDIQVYHFEIYDTNTCQSLEKEVLHSFRDKCISGDWLKLSEKDVRSIINIISIKPNKPNKPVGLNDKPNKPVGLNDKPNNHDSVSVYVSDSVFDYDSDLKEKEITEKPLTLVFPFSSVLFFEKWNLLVSKPKWKVKAKQSLQIALDVLKNYDEEFAIKIIEKSIRSEWAQFKPIEIQELYKESISNQSAEKSKANSKKRVSACDVSTLVYPFLSEKFKNAFLELMDMPKWKKKKIKSLQASLNQLGAFDEEFAISLISRSISGDYQGVVFPSTESDYEKWRKLKGRPIIDTNAIQQTNNYKEYKTKKEEEEEARRSQKGITREEYNKMKANEIEIKKDITPEELEEIRKKLKDL